MNPASPHLPHPPTKVVMTQDRGNPDTARTLTTPITQATDATPHPTPQEVQVAQVTEDKNLHYSTISWKTKGRHLIISPLKC